MGVPQAPLRVLSAAASLSPIPQVKTAIELVIEITKGVDNVKGSKRGLVALQGDLVLFVLALAQAGNKIKNDGMQVHIAAFTEQLEAIKGFVGKQLERGILKRIIFQDEIKDEILGYRKNVDTQYQLFTVKTMTLTVELLELEAGQRQADHEELKAIFDRATMSPTPAPTPGAPLLTTHRNSLDAETHGELIAANTNRDICDDAVEWETQTFATPLGTILLSIKDAADTWTDDERTAGIVKLQGRLKSVTARPNGIKSSEGVWLRNTLLCLRFARSGWYDAVMKPGQERLGLQVALQSALPDILTRLVSAGVLNPNLKAVWQRNGTAEPMLDWLDGVQDVCVIETWRRVVVATERNVALLLLDATPDDWKVKVV